MNTVSNGTAESRASLQQLIWLHWFLVSGPYFSYIRNIVFRYFRKKLYSELNLTAGDSAYAAG
jgi:hypothetical protein